MKRTLSRRLAMLVVATTACSEPSGPGGPTVASIALASTTGVSEFLTIPALGLARPFEVTVIGDDGQTLSGIELTWTARDASIVEMRSDGTMVGRSYGDVVVVVRAQSAVDSALVRVAQIPRQITIEGPDTITAGIPHIGVSATMIDSAGRPIQEPPIWVSSNASVVTVNEFGGVQSHGPGTASIFAHFRGVSAEFVVVVRHRPDYLWLQTPDADLSPGDTTRVTATLYGIGNEVIAGAPITWSTSDSAIAVVSATGKVSAVGGGNAVITARSGTITAHLGIRVERVTPPLGTLRLEPVSWNSDGWGEQIPLEAFVDDGVNPPIAVPATWMSRNPAVATTTPFLATTKGDGSTWLVAQYDGRTDSIPLQVSRVPIAFDLQGLPDSFAINFTDGAPLYPLTVDRFGGVAGVSPTMTVRDPTIAYASPGFIGALRGGTTWVVLQGAGLVDSLRVTVIPQWFANYTIATTADLDAFEALGIEEVVGVFRVDQTSLTSLDGLESLRRIVGPLLIRLNPSLSDMSGLSGLEVVTGEIVIETNPNLTVELPGLRQANRISTFGNSALTAQAFASLENVEGELNFADPAPFVRFDALEYTGSMMIAHDGPDSVSLPVLKRVWNDLTLVNSPRLTWFSAPELWAARTLTIERDSVLTALDLTGLATLTRDLVIDRNPKLTNLDGLSGLTSGIRYLDILDNPELTSIDGLRAIGNTIGADPLVGRLCIYRNAKLPTAHVDGVRQHLDAKFPGSALGNCPL